ncbi:hypothetical protein [Mesorhizobium sp. Mes31]|uniref:hypothetical protein n=1 Tax=Mesorhizobium sp. Mes31 TaxID=2926017 RepID=UPI0021191468|nr:hypothetical protein [Mesorhizobium sp. Mes31]
MTKIQQAVSAIFIGVYLSAFAFCFTIDDVFESNRRPKSPDLANGFTSLAHVKIGNFYGTPFESFVANHGIWTFSLLLIGALLSPEVRAGERLTGTVAGRRFAFSAAILSFAALLAVWWSGF